MLKHSLPFRTRMLAPALVIAWLAAGSVNAHADIITLEVTGTLVPAGPFAGSASCSSSGCTLSGYITIDNTPGASIPVISADVTVAGELPTVGPFTAEGCDGGCVGVARDDYGTALELNGPPLLSGLQLDISTNILGSLDGYAGGPILPGGVALSGIYSPSATWWLTTGSLTPTPEPASLCLLVLGSGVLLVGLYHHRRALSPQTEGHSSSRWP